MKAQTKAIVASVVVIALALSAVSGITYSWWSDTEQTNVTVNTGSLDVATSDYKLTLVTSSGTKTLASGDSAPETIAISYGGTTGTGVYELQGYGVDPTNLELMISYKATFKASVNYQYTIAASFPENIGTIGTATIDETTTSLPVQKSGEATTGASITHVYDVSIKITSLPAGVKNATAVLKNFITQKAANVVEDLSGVAAGTAATIVSQATTTGSSTTTTPVTVDFSAVPDGAKTLTAEISTESASADTQMAKIKLELKDSNENNVSLGDKQTSVSFTMDGYYTNVMYYNSSSSEYGQPSASFVYYDASGNVISNVSDTSAVAKTKITFTTTHFSEFVAYADEFPVSSVDDLKAAINAGVPKMKLGDSINLSGSLLITKDVTIDLNQKNLTVVYIDVGNGSAADVTFKNGGITSSTNGVQVYSDSTAILDDVDLTASGCGILMWGMYPTVEVRNGSTIQGSGYGIGTNATQKDGKAVYSPATVIVSDSTVTATGSNGDCTAILFNVDGNLTVTDSKLTGGRQCLILRAGTADISKTEFVYTAAYDGSDGTYEDSWGSGNRVSKAAVVVGNMSSTAYNTDAYLTLTDCSGLSDTTGTKTMLVVKQDGKNGCKATVVLSGTTQVYMKLETSSISYNAIVQTSTIVVEDGVTTHTNNATA